MARKKQQSKKKGRQTKRHVYQTMLESIPSGKRVGEYGGIKYESSRRRS